MKIQIQRLRNLTTGKLHTSIDHIYEDLEAITGEKGLMTHMLPRVNDAVKLWLRERLKDTRLWDTKYDPKHVGEVDIVEPTSEERAAMFKRFKKMLSPFAAP